MARGEWRVHIAKQDCAFALSPQTVKYSDHTTLLSKQLSLFCLHSRVTVIRNPTTISSHPHTTTYLSPKDTMAEHTYKFNVTMTCGGCSGAVERVLKKTEGKNPRQTPTPSTSCNDRLTKCDWHRSEILRRLPREANRRHHHRRQRQLRHAAGEDQEDGQDGQLGGGGWGCAGGVVRSRFYIMEGVLWDSRRCCEGVGVINEFTDLNVK